MLIPGLALSVFLMFQNYDDGGGGAKAIKWTEDPKAAVEDAKKTQRPIIFYVLGRSDDRDDDIERDQKRALADEMVVGILQRFVCCKLSRSRHRELLEKLGLKSEYQLYFVYVRPDGTMIDRLDGGGVADADTLRQKSAAVFRVYRKEMYEKELKSILTDTEAKPSELTKALETIDEFIILDADADVIALLKREGLDKAIAKPGYDLLAKMSTKKAVEFLLERVGEKDANAVKALPQCTPGGAEWMLPALDGEDLDVLVAAYQAMTKICKIKDVKPARFWEGKNEKLKADELQRVKGLVEKVAQKWKDRYEEYR